MFMFNEIKTMVDEELTALAKAVQVEQETRLLKQKEIMWSAVQQAVKDYIGRFGVIEISDANGDDVITIGYYDDFSTPGRMEVTY